MDFGFREDYKYDLKGKEKQSKSKWIGLYQN